MKNLFYMILGFFGCIYLKLIPEDKRAEYVNKMFDEFNNDL